MTVHNAQYARTPGAFDNNAYTIDEEETTEEGGRWRRSSSATSGRDSSHLLPADGDADSVFSDSSAAQATLPSRARLRLPQKHKYLQLRYDSESGYEVPIGCDGRLECAGAAAAAPPPPPGYQNCAAERLPAGSVDDIQFSFDSAEHDPRHSVASLLSQISGVAIDVDPGKTSWC
ncbi:uncharacterized protein LOC119101099 [Pollicipes pollicipes]|uniref:uncharacterized protein LOC119101099 n=1 Tax=Pollicipes pollicipes TaxID=41117 RepID=UPI001885201B|nr:uncharacterized protein LOC119101099 [Pollicipes pollicipes]